MADAFQAWLHDPKSGISEAREKTIAEHFFPDHDVEYGLQCFERHVTVMHLESWIDTQLSAESVIIPQKILCLHAGNLPLVGLQDVLACLILGYEYFGKISRRDPYLLPSFLEFWRERNPAESIHWSRMLGDFCDLHADAVLFSGSNETVREVRTILYQQNMADEHTRFLIRTAHLSMAYLDRDDSAWLKALAEAIARYEGRGCRSVGIVVSPLPLEAVECSLTDCLEAFWLDNPPAGKQTPALRYRVAYNKAVKRSQASADLFLIEENEPDLQNHVIYWVQGDETKAAELGNRFADQIQNIYVSGNHITIPGWEHRTDLLSRAQCPLISWQPDGVDVLSWLVRKG